MSQVFFKCDLILDGTVTPDDCIAHAISQGGQLPKLGCHFTPAILRGIADALKDEPMPDGAVRVTHLLGCAKRAQWQKVNPLTIDPRDAYALFRGQIGHAMVERYHGHEIFLSEERLMFAFDGVVITGKPDAVLDPKHGHLDDYKTTKWTPREPYPHHVEQANAYAWLLARCKKIRVKTAAIVYIEMGGVTRLDAPIWSRQKTEVFLRDRIGLWKTGTPTPSEWECKSCPIQDCPARIKNTRGGRREKR